MLRTFAAVVLCALGVLIAGDRSSADEPPSRFVQAPTAEQEVAIAGAVGEPADCLTIGISTVDATWAVAGYVGAAGRAGCARVAAGAVAYLHWSADTGWAVKARGQGATPPACPVAAMPTDVALNLGACTVTRAAPATTSRAAARAVEVAERCLEVAVARRSRRYAIAIIVSAPRGCSKYRGDEEMLFALRKDNGRWRLLDSGDCETASGSLRPFRGVPTQVGQDLVDGVCGA